MKQYSCTNEGCTAAYSYRTNLSRHKKSCKCPTSDVLDSIDKPKYDPDRKDFECPTCHMRSSRKANVVRHMKKNRCYHIRVKQQLMRKRCNICNKIFKRAYHMRRHKSAIHGDEMNNQGESPDDYSNDISVIKEAVGNSNIPISLIGLLDNFESVQDSNYLVKSEFSSVVEDTTSIDDVIIKNKESNHSKSDITCDKEVCTNACPEKIKDDRDRTPSPSDWDDNDEMKFAPVESKTFPSVVETALAATPTSDDIERGGESDSIPIASISHANTDNTLNNSHDASNIPGDSVNEQVFSKLISVQLAKGLQSKSSRKRNETVAFLFNTFGSLVFRSSFTSWMAKQMGFHQYEDFLNILTEYSSPSGGSLSSQNFFRLSNSSKRHN